MDLRVKVSGADTVRGAEYVNLRFTTSNQFNSARVLGRKEVSQELRKIVVHLYSVHFLESLWRFSGLRTKLFPNMNDRQRIAILKILVSFSPHFPYSFILLSPFILSFVVSFSFTDDSRS